MKLFYGTSLSMTQLGMSVTTFNVHRVLRSGLNTTLTTCEKLHAQPMLIGELKPFGMRATGLLSAEVSQTLILENIMSENFWRDSETNRWREPTDEERERMNDDRSLRVLHDAERYVSQALRRNTSDDERCEWIDA